MVKMRRAYADGPFGQVHFQHAAEGRPIVLLHQAIMSSEQFSNVFAPLFARGLRPIAIDMPGFGMSDAPDVPPTIKDYATCVMPVLDALGIESAAIAGHHTGALVATEVALDHAERIGAVVIHGPMIMDDDERRKMTDWLVTREKAFTAQPGGAHFAEIAEIREKLAEGTIGSARISDYVMQSMMAWQKGAYWYGHSAAFAYRHEEPLKRLARPTLLLTNTGDMMHSAALAGHGLRPDFDYCEIEGGGIDICDQAPEAWAAAIGDFLARRPEKK